LVKIFIDGGSRGNPGICAIGYVIFDEQDNESFRFGKEVGNQTNNFAEYSALLEVLEYLSDNNKIYKRKDQIVIYSDSWLVVNQVNGLYKVRSTNIIPLFQKIQRLLLIMRNISIKHIERENNKTADWIVNRVLDGKRYRPVDRSRKKILIKGLSSEESPGS
jgi:ribonuclease HI